MRSKPLAVIVAVAILATLLPLTALGRTSASPFEDGPSDQMPAASTSGRFLVELDLDVAPEAGLGRAAVRSQRSAIAGAADGIAQQIRGQGGDILRTYESVPALVAILTADEAAALAEDPAVLSVVPDIPLTPMLDPALPVIGADDDALTAIDPDLDGRGTAVVVVDAGVDRAHPFLLDEDGHSRVTREACFSGTGSCPNGTATQDGPGAAAPLGGDHHGTHVAGIIAGAGGPGDPTRGVASGTEVYAVQVFGEDGGSLVAWGSDILASLEWSAALATTAPIAAVNLSLGSSWTTPGTCDSGSQSFIQVIDTLRARGVVTVAAAGNANERDGMAWPACLSNVVSVAAVDSAESFAGFTNVSGVTDVAAPGVQIRSSFVGGGYDDLSGTSMAAPMVAGAVALMAQQDPTADTSTRIGGLLQSSTHLNDGRSDAQRTDLPLLDVPRAIDAVANGTTLQAPTSTPSLSTAGGDLQIALDWSSVERASSYEVRRTTGSSCSSSSPLRGTTLDPAAIDTGLKHGTTYRYCVRGANVVGRGPLSATQSHTATDLTAPAAPILSGTRTATSVSLSWPAVSDPTGPVTYRVYRSTSSTCSRSSTRIFTGTTRSVTDSGRQPATTYRYCATATDGAGNRSPLSSTLAIKTLSVPAPSFSSGARLAYDLTSQGDLVLMWPAASGSGTLTYEIRRDGTLIATTLNTRRVITGLRAGRDYRFDIRARDSHGQRSAALSRTFTPTNGFRDTGGSIFRHDINWLATGRTTRGCDPPANDRFCPDDAVTREQMAAFLVRALGLTESSGVRFRDVPSGSTFAQDIDRLAAAGITRGCNPPKNDRFCPRDEVTRAQMAAFLTRGLDLRATSGLRFTDVTANSPFVGDIDRLATAGITRGCNPPGNTRFCPSDPVTRAQMSAFLRRGLT